MKYARGPATTACLVLLFPHTGCGTNEGFKMSSFHNVAGLPTLLVDDVVAKKPKTVLRRQLTVSAGLAPHAIKLQIPNLSEKQSIDWSEGGDHDSHFSSNAVSTTKYTIPTFLPKTLYEQFQRRANLYFLLISILQMATPYSPTVKYATLVPLTLVLSLVALKEALEDYRRFLTDRETNLRDSFIVATAPKEFFCNGVEKIDPAFPVLQKMAWQNLSPGHVVYLVEGQAVPADILILSSSDAVNGGAFLETSELDGESSLKVKSALGDTKFERSLASLVQLEGMSVDAEPPTTSLESFSGVARRRGSIRALPLSMKNVMLRGSFLRNTGFVYGLVLFTGKETRLVMNSSSTPIKVSLTEKKINSYLGFVFGLLVLMVAGSMLVPVLVPSLSLSHAQREYYEAGTTVVERSEMAGFFVFLILYNNLVPVSLYISVDFVKGCQAFYMERDKNMWHQVKNGFIPLSCRTSALNADLGKIDYVFTDKTGTLTENKMVFRVASAGGRMCGQLQVLKELAAGSVFLKDKTSTKEGEDHTEPSIRDRFAFGVKEMSPSLLEFLECVLLCHEANAACRQNRDLTQRFVAHASPLAADATISEGWFEKERHHSLKDSFLSSTVKFLYNNHVLSLVSPLHRKNGRVSTFSCFDWADRSPAPLLSIKLMVMLVPC